MGAPSFGSTVGAVGAIGKPWRMRDSLSISCTDFNL